MKQCVIHNANAGANVIAQLKRRQFTTAQQCAFSAAVSAADVDRQVRTAVERGVERIIVAGGDGTVSRVVDILSNDFSRVDVAILPLGTGNDLARSMGIPLDNLDAAFELALSGESVSVDVVRVFDGETTYLINAASAGFGGQVAAHIDPLDKARWGAFAYWMTAVTELANLPQFDVNLKLDDRTFSSRVYGLTIANGRYLGGGFPIARKAFVNDGLIDVTVIPVLPTLELLAAGLNYMVGSSSGGDRLLNFRAKRVEVASTPEMLFSLDGEPVCEVEASFEVIPVALRVVAGPISPAIFKDSPTGTACATSSSDISHSVMQAVE